MHTTRFRNNNKMKVQRLESQIILKSLGARKTKNLNKITKLMYTYTYLFLIEINLGFTVYSAVRLAIYPGWNFTHTWKALA